MGYRDSDSRRGDRCTCPAEVREPSSPLEGHRPSLGIPARAKCRHKMRHVSPLVPDRQTKLSAWTGPVCKASPAPSGPEHCISCTCTPAAAPHASIASPVLRCLFRPAQPQRCSCLPHSRRHRQYSDVRASSPAVRAALSRLASASAARRSTRGRTDMASHSAGCRVLRLQPTPTGPGSPSQGTETMARLKRRRTSAAWSRCRSGPG